MDNKDNILNQGTPMQTREQILWDRAEALAREKEADLSVESNKVLHELRVHQIELEMQNDELRRSQEELENVRLRYFDLYDLAPIGYCTLSNDGQILESNLTLSNILGINRSLLHGMRISQFVLREDQDIYYLYIKQLFEVGESRECEFRLKRKDGHVIWVKMISTALLDSEGVPVYRVMLNDVTAWKLNEARILASEVKYKNLFTLESDALFLLDKETGKILNANDSACRVYGYELGELLTMNCTDMSAEPQETANALNEIHTQTVLIPVRYHKKKDGTVFPVEITASLFDLDNRQTVLVASRDITERLKTENEINENRRKLNDIIEFLPDATLVIDKNKKVIIWNKAMVEMTGVHASEMLGKGDYAYTIPFYGEPRPVLMDLLFADDNTLKMNYSKITREGRTLTAESFCPTLFNNKGAWIYAKAAPLYDNAGNFIGAIESIRDITERVHAQDALLDAQWKFKALYENGPIGVAYHKMIYDSTGKPIDYLFLDTNKMFIELTGVNPVGKTVLEAFSGIENDPFDWIGTYSKVAKTGITLKFEQYFQVTRQYFDVVAYQYKTDHFVTVFINNTERKEMETAFRNEKKLFETTLQSVGEGVISTDINGKVVFINKAAEELTGWSKEDANGKAVEEVYNIFNEKTREKGRDIVKKVIKDRKIRRLTGHTYLITKEGIEHPIEDSVAPIIQENGEIAGAVVVFKDCTEQKKKQDEIEFLSYHDQLTGTYNRRHYDKEIKRLDDEKYLPLTLIMSDVNGLKMTNDAFGHKTGDLVLKKVAAILRKECRSTDIVARIGGDEFVILLPETDAKHADIIVARINKAMSKEKINNIELSLSMGMAVKTCASEDMNEVYQNAEDEMYRHKLSESAQMKSRTVDLVLNALFEAIKSESMHSQRVSEICQAIATEMGIGKDEMNNLKKIGYMHDIGKIGIDLNILESSKKINSIEWSEIKRHSEIGYRILSAVNEFSDIADCVLEHHERWDGKGYPRGLKGERISLFARIVAIADSYDAMTCARTYKAKMSKEEAIEEIKRCAGSQFDPEIARVFIEKVLSRES